MKTKTRDLVFIALAAALITVCSWISIPLTVPITLQTFAIFTVVGLLGMRRGTIAVLIYILLGAVGIPVFSGFKGGIGALLGNTGGYIIGFIFSALLTGALLKLWGNKVWALIVSMILGLAVCYIFGTAWFMFMYTRNTGAVGLLSVLSWCVIPFLIPDAVKIGLSVFLVKVLKKPIDRL